MNVTNTQPNTQTSPIESVNQAKGNDFASSIRLVRNFYAICAWLSDKCSQIKPRNPFSSHKVEPIEPKKQPIPLNSFTLLSDSDASLPPSIYKTQGELDAMAPRVEQQQRAKAIETQNTTAINDYIDITDEDSLKYQQINKIGTAILSHPDYASGDGLSEGTFRVAGTKNHINMILQQVANNKPINMLYKNEEIYISIADLTSAYKQLVRDTLDTSSSEKAALSKCFTQYADALVNKNDVENFIKNSDIAQDKKDKILALSNTKISDTLPPLKHQPLMIQITIPLFIEVSRSSAKHKMTLNNLAIAFAPSLDRTDNAKTENSQAGLKEFNGLAQLSTQYFSALMAQQMANT